MLIEIAKPIAVALCLISLLAVFHAAFLTPAAEPEQKGLHAALLLALAGGICLSSGMLFKERADNGASKLTATLPVKMFFWALAVIVVLFLCSWYLETHCIFYKDVRRI